MELKRNTRSINMLYKNLRDKPVELHCGNISYSIIDKESLLELYDGYGCRREKDLIKKIKNGDINKITFRDIKIIFAERWFFVFTNIKKIKRDFDVELSLDGGDIAVAGSMRGQYNYIVHKLLEWYQINVQHSEKANPPEMTGDVRKDVDVIKKYIQFDVRDYRKIKKNIEKYRYLSKKIDNKNIYVFNLYNYQDIIPNTLGKEIQFEGSAMALETGELSLVITQNVSELRRITTVLSLLYAIISNHQVKNKQTSYLSQITTEHYRFVGYFLLKDSEINYLRKNIHTYRDLYLAAKKYGMSEGLLLTFLFKDIDSLKYREIYKDIPKGKNRGDGGPGWVFKERFLQHYSKKLLAQRRVELNKDTRREKSYAIKMICKGSTLKEKVKFLKEII